MSEGDSQLPGKNSPSLVAKRLNRRRSAPRGVGEPREQIDSRAARVQAEPVRSIPAHRGCLELGLAPGGSLPAQLLPLRDGLALPEGLQLALLPWVNASN